MADASVWSERARQIGLFRYALIRTAADPALSARQRGRLVRAVAAAEHTGPDGRPVRVSRVTVDRWVKAHHLPARGLHEHRPTTPTVRVHHHALRPRPGPRSAAVESPTRTPGLFFAAVLIGQPTLRRRIKLGQFAALDQRIALRYSMTGMEPARDQGLPQPPSQPGRPGRHPVQRRRRRPHPPDLPRACPARSTTSPSKPSSPPTPPTRPSSTNPPPRPRRRSHRRLKASPRRPPTTLEGRSHVATA